MKIVRMKISRYELPLVKPISIRGEELWTRSGWIIELFNDSGQIGWGEIAPLPGFSREDIESAQEQIDDLRNSLESIETKELFPSVRCGIEMALWNLSKRVGPLHLWINGLLSGTKEEVLREAKEMASSGYRTVKLKVGHRKLEEEIEWTQQIRKIIGTEVALRCDANRSWSFAEAERFAEGVWECAIEYLEEPLADPADLPRFIEKTSIPVALDESLLDLSIREIPRVEAVVLKPTLLGGLERTRQWVEWAQSLHIRPVISSLFETGVGIRTLAAFAATLPQNDLSFGFDTYRWLREDILNPSIEIKNGKIELGTSYTLNRELLDEVE